MKIAELITYVQKFESYDEFVGVGDPRAMYNLKNILEIAFPAAEYKEAVKRFLPALKEAGYRDLRDFYFSVKLN